MKSFGLASAAEFLQERIVYRNLRPADERLPGLETLLPQLGLPVSRVPRKHELAYGRMVALLLQAARKLDAPDLPLCRLFFIGDTELLDGAAFANLCQVQGWPGVAFIGAETDAPATVSIASHPDQRDLYLANRWAALEDFDRYCAQVGLPINEQAAVVIDLDKTILGARGRNSDLIDRARSQAMEQTLAGLLGERFSVERFYQVYRQFNQPFYHPFTSDNQDYLAYICLVVMAGMVEPQELDAAVRSGSLKDVTQLVGQMESRRGEMDQALAATHAEVFQRLQAGDPTPFKAFRRQEYDLTVSLMGRLPDSTAVEQMLAQEILLTQEVRQAALEWRSRGALLFGLSDKPDEASIPAPERAAQGFLPLHRTLTHAVGYSDSDFRCLES